MDAASRRVAHHAVVDGAGDIRLVQNGAHPVDDARLPQSGIGDDEDFRPFGQQLGQAADRTGSVDQPCRRAEVETGLEGHNSIDGERRFGVKRPAPGETDRSVNHAPDARMTSTFSPGGITDPAAGYRLLTDRYPGASGLRWSGSSPRWRMVGPSVWAWGSWARWM